MKRIGSFESKRWGTVDVLCGAYKDGQTAIALTIEHGEALATLSVNMYRPECSHDSRDLPAGCFYVKGWSENTAIAEEAFASGLFVVRDDLPIARSGYVSAPVWQVKP